MLCNACQAIFRGKLVFDQELCNDEARESNELTLSGNGRRNLRDKVHHATTGEFSQAAHQNCQICARLWIRRSRKGTPNEESYHTAYQIYDGPSDMPEADLPRGSVVLYFWVRSKIDIMQKFVIQPIKGTLNVGSVFYKMPDDLTFALIYRRQSHISILPISSKYWI